ncbi:MAG: hypothetical protein KDJ80_03990 [Nitratireductor sp.]|nr:hypothetical protein [Nitratireductor sp.]
MSEEPVTEDLIRYDVLTQNALRSVIRKVLEEVAVAGLPGDHHFFITFDTTAPGVRLSKRMRERYPESMAIVIQHTYWNLVASETGFEVDLTFNDIRERVVVPYAAIQAFFDPSVKFGLQFDVSPEELSAELEAEEEHEVIELAGAEGAAPGNAAEEPARDHAKDDGRDGDRQGEVVSLDAFRNKK